MAIATGTLVPTDSGPIPVELLHKRDFRVFDGEQYEPGEVALLENCPIVRTKLVCGLQILTSPSQQFRIVPKETMLGYPVWRAQQDLEPGDRVFVSYRRTDAAFDPELFLLDQEFRGWQPTRAFVESPLLWQMIGHASLYGVFPDPTLIETSFRVLVYTEHDRELLQRYSAFLNYHDIPTSQSDGPPIQMASYHYGFQSWLRALGFVSPTEGESRVSPSLLRAPAALREAFLQGVFSARGKWTKQNHPLVVIPLEQLHQQVLQTLWSVGVSTESMQLGWQRSGNLRVRDRNTFCERVNFLQSRLRKTVTDAGTWDKPHYRSGQIMYELFRKTLGWRYLRADEREVIFQAETAQYALRRSRLLEFCKKLDMEPPEIALFHHGTVDVLDLEPVAEGNMYELSTGPGQYIGAHMVLR